MAKTKSPRLTEALRNVIVTRVVESKFAARKKAVRKQRLQLAEDIYADIVPDQAILQALPDGYMAEAKTIDVHLAGKRITFHLDDSRLMPHCLLDHYTEDNTKYPPGHRFIVRFDKLDIKEQQLKADENKLRQTAASVVHAATTTAKLLEAWPEAEAFLPKTALPIVETALVVHVDTLKQLLAS